jgi:hypothetical protein
MMAEAQGQHRAQAVVEAQQGRGRAQTVAEAQGQERAQTVAKAQQGQERAQTVAEAQGQESEIERTNGGEEGSQGEDERRASDVSRSGSGGDGSAVAKQVPSNRGNQRASFGFKLASGT